MIEAPALEQAKSGKYICPECQCEYASNWIRRHLVYVHDYRYYDDNGTQTNIVYKEKK